MDLFRREEAFQPQAMPAHLGESSPVQVAGTRRRPPVQALFTLFWAAASIPPLLGRTQPQEVSYLHTRRTPGWVMKPLTLNLVPSGSLSVP